MAVVIALRGPSGSGKTTLIERLLPRLTARGLKVGVMKHAHDGFAVDQHGKDSQRFWDAGARAVLVAGPDELFVRQRCASTSLSELLQTLPQELDCVFIEGFAHTAIATEVRGSVRIEFTDAGTQLNGHPIPVAELAGAVEEVVTHHLERPSGCGWITRGTS